MIDFLMGLLVCYNLFTDHGKMAIVLATLWGFQWLLDLIYKTFLDDTLKINIEDFKRYKNRFEIKYCGIKAYDDLASAYIQDKMRLRSIEEFAALKEEATQTFERIRKEHNDKQGN